MEIITRPQTINWTDETSYLLLNPRRPKDSVFNQVQEEQFQNLTGTLWISSSGTAGPKLVALSKSAFLISALAVNSHLQAKEGDRWLCALPFFHVGGLAIYARSQLLGKEPLSLGENPWSPKIFVDSLALHKIRFTSLVPHQIYDLVHRGLRPPPDLKWVLVGGGALSQNLYHKASCLGWPLLPSYGLTECASTVAIMSPRKEQFPKTFDSAKANEPFIYQILPHCQISLLGQKSQTEPGIIHVRGPSVCRGYIKWKLNSPRLTKYVALTEKTTEKNTQSHSANSRYREVTLGQNDLSLQRESIDHSGCDQSKKIKPVVAFELSASIKMAQQVCREIATSDIGILIGNEINVLGREDDLFKISGELVNLEYLNALLQDQKLKLGLNSDGDCLLISRVSEQRGNEIELLISKALWPWSQQLTAAYNQMVHPFERIRHEIQIERLPKTALGKIDKTKLSSLNDSV